jgi:hypothetical protein
VPACVREGARRLAVPAHQNGTAGATAIGMLRPGPFQKVTGLAETAALALKQWTHGMRPKKAGSLPDVIWLAGPAPHPGLPLEPFGSPAPERSREADGWSVCRAPKS